MTNFLNINKNFTPQLIGKASQAAEGLCKWVRAIFNYYHVYKAITPLREDLDKANAVLKEASDELARKRAFLKEVEDKCHELDEKLRQESFAKQTLIANIKECETKMKRAMELTSGL